MIRKATHVSLVIPDQDEALAYYTDVLGFEVRANNPFPGDPSNRWITVAPQGQSDLEIILEPLHWGLEGDPEAKRAMIGKYPGFVLDTDDCAGDVAAFEAKGGKVLSPPEQLPWGISAVIEDKYGYRHNLLQATQWENPA